MGNVDEEQEEVKKGRPLAFLSYLGVLAILPFIFQSDNEYAVAHGRQGLALFAWFVAASFFSIMPVLGPLVFVVSAGLVLILSFVGMMNALAGRTWTIPVVGNLF